MRGSIRVHEELHRLLFELSSAERINMLTELKQNKLKLTQISNKLDLTLTEASRHLQRLNEKKLIQKGNDGCFALTPFGQHALTLLSGLNFMSGHKDYFMEYTLSEIPDEFVTRIGELEGGIREVETLRNLQEGEAKIGEANKFVWILSDQILQSVIPTLSKKANASFDLRIILPEGKFPSESKSRLPAMMGVQKRVLPKVDVLVVMTEKYAVFCLPNQSGKIDYTGFTGTDPKFHKWCKDLFLYYWGEAKPIGTG